MRPGSEGDAALSPAPAVKAEDPAAAAPAVALDPAVPAPAVPAELPAGETGLVADRPLGPGVYQPGKGFTLRTQDGDFALSVRLWGQLLYTLLSPGAAGKDDRHSVQLRRARVSLAGNMWGEDTRYKVELAVAPRDLRREPVNVVGLPEAPVDASGMDAALATERDVVQAPPLLDWYVDFTQIRDLNVRAGQAKVPFSRQRMMPDSDSQFVDTRITNDEFNLDRDIGIDFRAPDLLGAGVFRYYAGLYAGEGPNGSDKTLGAGEPGFMYLVRAELLPLGMFADVSEADFERSDDARLSVGLAYALVQGDAVSPQADAFGVPVIGGAEMAPLVDFNAHNFTADAMFKLAGASVGTAFHHRKVDGTFGGADPQNGLGWMLQAGYLLPRTIVELAAAYALIRGSGATSLRDDNEAGGGVNLYFARHWLKLQGDVFHLWGPTRPGGGDNRLRLQLQASL
jgi:hypothetical protein